MRHLIFFFLGILFICLSSPYSFSSPDRVLIFSPHPDDEAIALGGTIQKFLEKGAQIKICYFTNGDYNEISYIVSRKWLPILTNGFLATGNLRKKESQAALKLLNIKRDQLIFLGYPDRFTETILFSYWDKNKPFKSMLTKLDRVFYPDAFSPGAPYIGESILKDIKEIIKEFRPTKIFVSSPLDTNPDHRSLPVFLQIALWDLEKQYSAPEVFYYPVHKRKWPPRKGFYPDKELDPPYQSNYFNWIKTPLNQKEIETKRRLILAYKSQIKLAESYLLSFVRKNELYYKCAPVDLKTSDYEETINLIRDIEVKLSLRKDRDFIYLNISFSQTLAEKLKVIFYLLPYRKDRDFAFMPKILFRLDKKRIVAYKGRKRVDNNQLKGLEFRVDDDKIYLKIPLSFLNNPQSIFIKTVFKNKLFTVNYQGWQTFLL